LRVTALLSNAYIPYVLFSPGMSSFSTKTIPSRLVFQMYTNVQVVDCLLCCKAFAYFNGTNMQNFNSAKNVLRACLTPKFHTLES